MRVRKLLAVVVAVFAAFRLGGVSCWAADEKLRLAPDMVINETGLGDARLLVDEQSAVGDPRRGPGSRPERAYLTGWKDWMFPAHLILDFGPDQDATSLSIFNNTGKHVILVATGTPARWGEPRELKLDEYRHWHNFVFDAPTRYARITLKTPTALPELVAYGVRRESKATPATPKASRPPRPTFDQLIGVNAFIDDPIEKLIPVSGTMREYHNIIWDVEHPDHRLRFQPSAAAGGNAWFFDDYYAKLHAAGVTVAPCVQQSLTWLTGDMERDVKPTRRGADPADPAAYADHAAHMFQLAARYGRRTLPDAELTLADGQPRRSGLGTIRFFENANEPDKNWKGRAAMSSPFEFAAQCSADYDGHGGALGPGHGVRAADPQAKMVLGGLYRDPLVYLDAIRFWAEHHRDGSFPADVINVHHYCGDGDEQQAFKTRGISPEDGGLQRRMAELVAWRDRHVPSAEVWVTEFGYDTHPGSPLHAPAIHTLSAEVVQGAWLVRSYLLLAAAGVDRATMFMFRDVNSTGSGVFETSGLVTQKGRWEPKASWYFQATLKQHLAGMQWEADVPSGRENVRMFRFTKKGRTAFAVWCPTSEDRREKGFRLPVEGTKASLVAFVADQPGGRTRALTISEGKVTIDVSEVPSLVLVD